MKPEASIVIPCYNQGEFLKDSVGSALAQTHPGCEVIVVDDGSTDEKTRAAMAALPPQVRVLRTENRGLPAARNHGIAAAAGEYICCLDADDVLDREYVSETAAVLRSDTERRLGFVTTWMWFFGEEVGLKKQQSYDLPMLLLTNIVHVASMFRKRCWEEVGGYDETFVQGYEDWEFWISIAERGHQWACVEKVLFRYRRRKGSMVARSDAMRGELIGRIVRKHIELYRTHVAGIVIEADEMTGDLRSKLRALEQVRALRLVQALIEPVRTWRDALLYPVRIARLFVPVRLKDAIKARFHRKGR